jgi:hypothetical protein
MLESGGRTVRRPFLENQRRQVACIERADPEGSVRAESVLEPRMPESRQFIIVRPRKGRAT